MVISVIQSYIFPILIYQIHPHLVTQWQYICGKINSRQFVLVFILYMFLLTNNVYGVYILSCSIFSQTAINYFL